jgi:hypothetical protein
MNKRIGITCLVILVSACLLIGIIAASGVGVYLWDQNNPQQTTTPAPTLSNLPNSTSCPTDSCLAPTIDATIAVIPTVELPRQIARSMDQIQKEVIEIRGLLPKTTIPRDLLTPEQLHQNVITDFLSEYTPEDANRDMIILSILGLLPSDFNLLTFYEDLYSEQIAGYYDDVTKEMYVVSGSGFNGPEKMTYAHEFTHILQDQNYDFQNVLGMGDESCKEDSERCAATSALIEGDASLTEYKWFFHYATEQDQSDIQSFYESFQSPVYDSSPEYMKSDFLFPYSDGQEFVQVLFDQGGWQAVNNAYTNPPVSTEQIIHPYRYPADTPVIVNLPDLTSALGGDWEQIESDVVGEWYTYLILAKGYVPEIRLDDSDAYRAAEGWGGDAYQVYHNSITNQTVLIIKTTWDTNQDAKEFYDAFKTYGKTRWGSPSSGFNPFTWFMNLMRGETLPDSGTKWQTDTQSAMIRDFTTNTLIVIAPDANTVDLIMQTLEAQ